jgi:recombination associated protein RdgC
MGALNGSLGATKFYVEGELPKDIRRSYMERIRLRVFKPLKVEEEAEERAGWCALGQALDLELSPDKVFNGPYLVLGLRLDRYRFPAAVINAELARVSRETLKKSGQERLSRTQKSEIKVRVVQGLRRKYLPSMQVVDVVWHLDRGQLFFWSQSAAFQERLGALFELSFGLELTADSPYVAARRLSTEPSWQASLNEITLTPFHGEVV